VFIIKFENAIYEDRFSNNKYDNVISPHPVHHILQKINLLFLYLSHCRVHILYSRN
jgi:hypothetical protein